MKALIRFVVLVFVCLVLWYLLGIILTAMHAPAIIQTIAVVIFALIGLVWLVKETGVMRE